MLHPVGIRAKPPEALHVLVLWLGFYAAMTKLHSFWVAGPHAGVSDFVIDVLEVRHRIGRQFDDARAALEIRASLEASHEAGSTLELSGRVQGGAPFSLGPQPSRHVSSAQLYPKFIEFRAMSVVRLKLKAES
jgi:hypothetical protein